MTFLNLYKKQMLKEHNHFPIWQPDSQFLRNMPIEFLIHYDTEKYYIRIGRSLFFTQPFQEVFTDL